MTQEEINSGNILIAQFLGWDKGFLGEWTDPEEKPSTDNFIKIYYPDGSDMKFHSDWSWQGRVVDKVFTLLPKLENIEDERANQNQLMGSDVVFAFTIWSLSREEVFNYIIKYINWYNLNYEK